MSTERPKSSFFRRDDAEGRKSEENREVSQERKPRYENREGGERQREESRERREWKPRAENNGERREWKSSREGEPRRSWTPREDRGERREWTPREDHAERKPWGDRNQSGERREWKPRNENSGERREWTPREDRGERKPWGDRNQSGERREWKPRNENSGERREWKPRAENNGERRGWTPRGENAERKPWASREGGERKSWTPREGGERKPWGERNQSGERREWKSRGDGGERKPWTPRNSENPEREWKPSFEKSEPRTYLTRERRLKDRAANAPLTEKIESDPNAPMRLNRYIAMSGVCSRREADILITEGQVTVNGEVVDQLGAKVTRADKICLNGELLKGEKKVYIIMNKPKGFVTTTDDPHADRTILDLLKGEVKERVYPIGRLDKNTTGVLLLTNDGELTNELTHPSFEKRKLYHVFLNKPCTQEDLDKILTGLELEDGEIKADAAEFVDGLMDEVGIEIHSGRNRIVRRMFEHLGYDVVKLDRVYFAGFTKMGLRRGFWRFLSPREVATLKGGSYN